MLEHNRRLRRFKKELIKQVQRYSYTIGAAVVSESHGVVMKRAVRDEARVSRCRSVQSRAGLGEVGWAPFSVRCCRVGIPSGWWMYSRVCTVVIWGTASACVSLFACTARASGVVFCFQGSVVL